VVDRDRLTCTGGVAPLDMMLRLIEARLGRELAAKVSEQFVVGRVRRAGDPQHVPLRTRVGPGHRAVTKVAQAMAQQIERPVEIQALASLVDMSERQIERLFKEHVGTTPSDYYMAVRLDRARALSLPRRLCPSPSPPPAAGAWCESPARRSRPSGHRI
jgi:transcriptional regulator GlxA family with amidase domain